MALSTATVWEIRTTGSQANGGGFWNRSPGTSVDYSQQDAAQLTRTDLATNVAGTGLSSVTGGFTQAMIGNIVQISGGTLTAGWYEITGYTDTNNVTLDRSAGSSKSGGTGNVGGAFLLGGALDNDFSLIIADGNKVHIKAGTYTLGESVTGSASSSNMPIVWEGYNTTRGDAPSGANLPVISCGDYIFGLQTYNIGRYIQFTGTGTSTVTMGTGNTLERCKITNSSATAGRYAVTCNYDMSSIITSELISTNGIAATIAGSNRIINCYIHDSVSGVLCASHHTAVIGNVIDTCSTNGVYWTTSSGHTVMGNTIYACGTGIKGTTGTPMVIANNIITACTTAGFQMSSGGYDDLAFCDYNCFYNPAGTDRVNTMAGPHDVDSDPLLTDPANGDFTLDTSSPCFNTGVTLDATVGL